MILASYFHISCISQEVLWPPLDHHRAQGSVLPNLKGTVPMGKERREMMDKEFENVVKSSFTQYSSHPFNRGNDSNLHLVLLFLISYLKHYTD